MYHTIKPYLFFLPLLSIFFFSSSCKTDKGDIKFSLTPGKSFSFPFTYPINSRYTSIINDKNGNTVFCSYNSKTFKRIDLFTLDGSILKTVPLEDVLILENSISDVAPISADSFWVLANYSNNLYLINSEGNILRQIRINATPVDSLRMEVRGSILSNFRIDNNTFLFSCTYYYKDEDKPYTLSTYFKTNKAQPYFLKMQSPFNAAPEEMMFGFPGFYNRIFKDEDGMCAESAMYVPTPEGILLTSWYTDSLFLINDKNFSVKKAIKMTSKYSTIGCTPLTTKEFQSDNRALDVKLLHSGGVLSVCYDSFRGLIYVIIRSEAEKGEEGPSLNKSMLVYDTALNFKNEIRLDETQYDLSELYVLKEGLLIQKKGETHNNSDTKFQLFYVDKK